MQDPKTNDQNNLTDSFTSSQTQNTSDGPVVDLPTIATIALHNSPPWAGDILASIPEEDGPTSATESGARSPAASQPRVDLEFARRQPVNPVTLSECPLHTAMRHLAEAAVAQHILYLEGEVRARPSLLNTVARWDRMHTLIRECVCPTTREIAIGTPTLAEIADTILEGVFTPGEQHLRAQFVRALEACAACTSTSGCPLGASSD